MNSVFALIIDIGSVMMAFSAEEGRELETPPFESVLFLTIFILVPVFLAMVAIVEIRRKRRGEPNGCSFSAGAVAMLLLLGALLVTGFVSI